MIGPLFWFCTVTGAITILWQLIGGTLYDARALRLRARQQRHPYARAYTARPPIDVIILAPSSQSSALAETLHALQRNSYRNRTITVMAYGINQRTAAAQRQQVAATGISRTRYHWQLTDDREMALHTALRKYTTAAYICIIEAGQQLDEHALRHAMRHFQTQPHTDAILPHREIGAAFRLSGLVDKYLQILVWHGRKADSAIGTLRCELGTIMLRRPAAAVPAIARTVYYADDVRYTETSNASLLRIYSRRRQTMQRRLQDISALWAHRSRHKVWPIWLRHIFLFLQQLLILCLPLIVGYCIYVTIAAAQPTLLFVSCGLCSTCMIFAIMDEPGMPVLHKFFLTLGMPCMYGVFLVLGCVQYLIAAALSMELLARACLRILRTMTLRPLRS